MQPMLINYESTTRTCRPNSEPKASTHGFLGSMGLNSIFASDDVKINPPGRIAVSKRAYRATRINDVNWDQLAQGKEGLDITLGVDVGKFSLWAVCRWADGRFERPWRVQNPGEVPTLLTLLKQVSAGRKLVVAMESSGTYGDALRQALADNQIEVQRVGGKAAHDYAEVFDGVPSQHDGKDAAVVAELAALGKAMPWEYQPADPWEQELAYWVEWMVAHRQMLTIWQGRLEGLLARHWPEATQVLKLSL